MLGERAGRRRGAHRWRPRSVPSLSISRVASKPTMACKRCVRRGADEDASAWAGRRQMPRIERASRVATVVHFSCFVVLQNNKCLVAAACCAADDRPRARPACAPPSRPGSSSPLAAAACGRAHRAGSTAYLAHPCHPLVARCARSRRPWAHYCPAAALTGPHALCWHCKAAPSCTHPGARHGARPACQHPERG